jgi:N-methylhydantoinase A
VRFAVDTGGTFTDLVIEDDDGRLSVHKSPTVPADPVQGILDVFTTAAEERGVVPSDLLKRGTHLIHGTTRGLNAVLTGATARTAFLTTAGHPDILVFREGGRTHIFDLSRPYPDPYVPRSLTFEIPERIGPDGGVLRPLDELAVLEVVERLRERTVEAVAVCFLWSIVNPAHELRVGELLAEHLPGVPVTLSHRLNPCLREYRRASSACIDASLKPVMTAYIGGLKRRLAEAGFEGRLLIVTSAGGALDADDVAAAPIHSLNSGPAMAPVAGRYFAQMDSRSPMAIVADTGGTSYDVSVIRRGRIPWTRETWLGEAYFGHMTGFPSVDVRSIGAGGGSIAWVDAGGLLHVGPESAGADPGPACYGRGGTRPTLADACVVLNFIDPDYFLGGRLDLNRAAAVEAVRTHVAGPLRMDDAEAAAAIVKLATERMVSAIEAITIHKGIDPRQAVLVGGGGAAGLNVVAIARRLGCAEIIVPTLGPALSAAGALISELSRSFELLGQTTSVDFDYERVDSVLGQLEARCQEFIEGPGVGSASEAIEFSVEARYPHQVWELEVPMRGSRIRSAQDLGQLCQDFHAVHRDVFAIAEEGSMIEFESWHARVRCALQPPSPPEVLPRRETRPVGRRQVFLPDTGEMAADVWHLESLPIGAPIPGPAIVESEITTVVIEPDVVFRRQPSGTLHMSWPGRPGSAEMARAGGTERQG